MRGLALSLIIHVGIIAAGAVYLPSAVREFEVSPVVPVELVTIADVTNVRAAAPEPEPEPEVEEDPVEEVPEEEPTIEFHPFSAADCQAQVERLEATRSLGAARLDSLMRVISYRPHVTPNAYSAGVAAPLARRAAKPNGTAPVFVSAGGT